MDKLDLALKDLLKTVTGFRIEAEQQYNQIINKKKKVYATIDISDFTVLQIEEMAREGIIKEIKYN